jgi:N-acetylglucosaminyldiphosphoundecaprenol N-acetyl-beta-D-mannosaminyltransferase
MTQSARIDRSLFETKGAKYAGPPLAPVLTRVNVLGVAIHATRCMSDALATAERAIIEKRKGYICATGVHGVMESMNDSQLRSILNRSTLNLPDGRPMVWVGWLTGQHKMAQVTGPDFMLRLCALSAVRGYTHFLYGGKEGVADELKDVLINRFPRLRIVGTYTPPFRPLSQSERVELKAHIARLKPDVFWVGLSTPKQERFMAEYLESLDTTVMIGIGAAFDLHTGNIQDAPYWVKVVGMQWFHRLLQEPRRLWKRYLLNNPKFLINIAGQLLGLKKYALS